MNATRLLMLYLLFYPGSLLAQESLQTITITLQNDSLFQKTLQVRDDICPSARPNDCLLAEALLTSARCRSDRSSVACRDAQQIVDSSLCVNGLRYEMTLRPGEAATLDLCQRPGEHGRVSVRRGQNGPWVHHLWLNAGDSIDAP